MQKNFSYERYKFSFLPCTPYTLHLPFSKKLSIHVISHAKAMWNKRNECHIAAFFTKIFAAEFLI
jgi:hypothetical protein